MTYRELFVKVELSPTGWVEVTNDAYYVEGLVYPGDKPTQAEFDQWAQTYLRSDRFREKLERQREQYRERISAH